MSDDPAWDAHLKDLKTIIATVETQSGVKAVIRKQRRETYRVEIAGRPHRGFNCWLEARRWATAQP